MIDVMQKWVEAMREDRFDLAWALSEQVLAASDPATRDDPRLPYHQRWVWDGRSFDGRHVLVRCYHGLGDTIQFARFLPRLAARAASLTLEVQPALLPILATMPGVDRLVPFDPARPLPPAECDIEITELAFALRDRPSDAAWPYLKAQPALLPRGTVAICPSASSWDESRCVPSALFRPICEQRRCLVMVPQPTDLPVLNPGGCTSDIAVTASMLTAVELVITVDTMVAHLAGALGRPTWLLLKADPDWRWTPGTGRSGWYPSMRLYMQSREGDWTPVLEQVGADLQALSAGVR
jgi:ADP-heptose:LPS heptosyltransferase